MESKLIGRAEETDFKRKHFFRAWWKSLCSFGATIHAFQTRRTDLRGTEAVRTITHPIARSLKFRPVIALAIMLPMFGTSYAQVFGTAPTNLGATPISTTRIDLSWDAGGLSSFVVERCQGAGCSNFAEVGTTTSSAFSDTGLAA